MNIVSACIKFIVIAVASVLVLSGMVFWAFIVTGRNNECISEKRLEPSWYLKTDGKNIDTVFIYSKH
jgi:hypothetical protein